MSEKTTRESMVFYNSFYEAIKHLPAEEFKKSACAIFEYGFCGDTPKSYGIEYSVFTLVKLQIDTNNKRWNNAKKSHNGKKNTKAEAVETVSDDTPFALAGKEIHEATIETDDNTDEEDFDEILEENDGCEIQDNSPQNMPELPLEVEHHSNIEMPGADEITSSIDFRNSVLSSIKSRNAFSAPAVDTKPSEQKEPMGEYSNVFLSVKEKASLVRDFGVDGMMEAVDFLSRYLKRKPFHKSVCHYEDIRGWVTRALEERKQKAPVSVKDAGFDIDFEDIYEK